MTTPNTPMTVPPVVQESIVQFVRQAYDMQLSQWNLRTQLANIDRAYMREQDYTKENVRAKMANRSYDPTKFQNVAVPVLQPQVEAAVAYQTSVFLTGVPLFGVVSNPSNDDIALQMESIIDENAVRGGWTKEFIQSFRDVYKYNISAVEVEWDRQVTAALETNTAFDPKEGKPKEVIWEGNTVRRLDPYNLIIDTRVPPAKLAAWGEFAGYTELMSRIRLKDYINKLPDKIVSNVKAAFESGTGGNNLTGQNYYIPEINPDATIDTNLRASTNWMAWANLSLKNNSNIIYKDIYEKTVLYARILPSDYDLRVPAANTPQIWKFVVINSQVLIYAERQTNAHNLLPILMYQAIDDGLQYQTKSFATNLIPFQAVASALVNSMMASRRRAISDRTLYDPSRISEKDINSDNPSAKIPVKPAAYGKPLNESVFPIPFRDDQAAQSMQDMSQILKFADTVSGQNQAQQGQFVKGNKTLHEYADVMSHSNGKNQLTALGFETDLFTPLKNILKLNILQYQGGVSVYNRELQEQIDIDPVALRKAVMEFEISDGLTPNDKLINGDDLGAALQTLGTSPQLSGSYNLGPLFSHLMKTRNVNLTPFEKSPQQVAYEGAMQQWQNAVQQIVKANPAASTDNFPAQPTPEQYGWNPSQQVQSEKQPTGTILEQVMATMQPPPAQSGTPAPGQPATPAQSAPIGVK